MIKVISQNAMSWEHKEFGPFDRRRPLMKKAVENADIIGFQEVIPTWKSFFDTDLEGYDHILVYRSEKNLEATPIYWKKDKFNVLDSGHFWLSETPEKESFGWDAKCVRITCWVLFENIETGNKFAFVNTHLDHRGETARINGIQLICDFINRKFGKDMPIILTGDFNAQPGSATIEKANSLLTDARASAKESTDNYTFHGFEHQCNAIIDYIYISDNIECEKFETIRVQDGVYIQSDHLGICATLNI